MRLIKSEEIYKGSIVNLTLRSYHNAEGQEIQREVIEHPGSVVILPLLAENQVLLVKQYRAGAGRELLELPAGLVEPGESLQNAARRELEEETGYRNGEFKSLFSMYASPGFLNEQLHIFLARDLTQDGTLERDHDEKIELETMSFQDLRLHLRAGNIKDGKTIAALSWFFTFGNTGS